MTKIYLVEVEYGSTPCYSYSEERDSDGEKISIRYSILDEIFCEENCITDTHINPELLEKIKVYINLDRYTEVGNGCCGYKTRYANIKRLIFRNSLNGLLLCKDGKYKEKTDSHASLPNSPMDLFNISEVSNSS